MSKLVHRYDAIRQDILDAADRLAGPVRQTMSPQGRNVIFENNRGGYTPTNDGVTIAKQIEGDDPTSRAVIEVMKSSALQTNNKVGDGTSTTILLANELLHEVFKLKEDGMRPTEIVNELELYRDNMQESLEEHKEKIDEGDPVLEEIAHISANNDREIAEDVFKAIQQAGTDGMISIEVGDDETEIEIDDGYVILSGLISPELRAGERTFEVESEEVPVLVVNKRIYYKEEAKRIMQTVVDAGYNDVVVVAREFIGEAPNVFISNHNNKSPDGINNVMLVEDPRADEHEPQSLEDLALYLNGKFVSESRGDLVNSVTIDDFCIAKSAKVGMQKAVFERYDEENEELEDRIANLQEDVDDDEDSEARRALASLTEGLTTIYVGGKTNIERTERAYRYEDAIHACRAALEDGFVRGGGMSLWTAFLETQDEYDEDMVRVLRKVSQSPVRQILDNCGEHVDSMVDELSEEAVADSQQGYNAATGEITDIVSAGVVDPVRVAKQSIEAAVSIVNQIISSNYLILNDEPTNTEPTGSESGDAGEDGGVSGGPERPS